MIILNNWHSRYLFLLLFLDMYVSKFKVCLHSVGAILTYGSVLVIDFRLLWYPCHLICFTIDYLAWKSCYCLMLLVAGSWRCVYHFHLYGRFNACLFYRPQVGAHKYVYIIFFCSLVLRSYRGLLGCACDWCSSVGIDFWGIHLCLFTYLYYELGLTYTFEWIYWIRFYVPLCTFVFY